MLSFNEQTKNQNDPLQVIEKVDIYFSFFKNLMNESAYSDNNSQKHSDKSLYSWILSMYSSVNNPGSAWIFPGFTVFRIP